MFIERKLDSLYGLIVIRRVEGAPLMLHCATYPKKEKLEIEQYVRLSALPIGLSNQIRDIVAKICERDGDGEQSLETRMEFRKIRDEERKMEEENDELGHDVGKVEKQVTSV